MLLVYLSSVGMNPLLAQWVKTNGPNTHNVHTFAAFGTIIFTGTERGVYLSTNNGTSWMQVITGLSNIGGFKETPIGAFAVMGPILFAAGSGGGIFLSTNSGASWTQTGLMDLGVYALAVIGKKIFAGTISGVFISTNNGTSWGAVNTRFTDTPVYAFTAAVLISSPGLGTVASFFRPTTEQAGCRSITACRTMVF